MFHRSWCGPGRDRIALLLSGLLVLGGCGSGNGPVTAVPATPTPKNLGKVAVIRLGGDANEPAQKDLVDGLKEEGLVEGTSYAIETKDAGGDPSRIDGLVDEAVKGGANVVVALTPRVAAMAAPRAGAVPVVGYLETVPPGPLGLTPKDEPAFKVTGAYCPLKNSSLISMACGCLPPERRRLGILVDPGDPASVAIKESLLTADRGMVTVAPSFEAVEVSQPGSIAGAVEELARRKVSLLLLVPGKGIDDRAVIEAAARAKIPVFGYSEAQAKAGAVLVRYPSPRWGGFEVGRRAARVLKGMDPRALPFQEGSVFLTTANEPASKALGFKIAGEFLRTANILK